MGYYADAANLNDISELESRLRALLQAEITSLESLEAWLADERTLRDEITEVMTGHRIDFYRDTTNARLRDVYLHDQSVVQPLVTQYQAALDRKFCDCPFTPHLDEQRYGLLRRARQTRVALFREESIPLTVREQALCARVTEIMGGLTVEWDGETMPYAFAQAQSDGPDRAVRERAWRAMAEARSRVKPELDEIMTELVRLRHQMATQAGFANYRDYLFTVKQREYTVQDCYDFHASAEAHLVPAWDRLGKLFQTELGLDEYRPWDIGPCSLQGAPYGSLTELLDGVEAMLRKTDPYFGERFRFMRNNGLLDVGSRQGKRSGAFCEPLPATRNAFVFSGFGASFTELIALIHEMGHALNSYLQFGAGYGEQEHNYREEVAELYSHGLELLTMDKLNVFYKDEHGFKHAQREQLHRALRMLINPLSGDLFQHWLYTNPDHSPAERDARYLEISKRFLYHSADVAGVEAEIGESWAGNLHFFAYPFYKVQYAMSMLGALQLLQIYREDPARAVALYKQGAGANIEQSVAEIYRDTGVQFDFSAAVVQRTAKFVERLIADLP